MADIIRLLNEELEEKYDFSEYNLDAYRKGIRFAIDTISENDENYEFASRDKNEVLEDLYNSISDNIVPIDTEVKGYETGFMMCKELVLALIKREVMYG